MSGRRTRKTIRGRARGERGVALVEFAIVFPVLFMIIIGMLTGGIVLNRQMALSHATREAARWGATVPLTQFGTPAAWAAEVQKVGVERSGNELKASNICVSLLEGSTVRASTTGSACISGTTNTGWRVQVTATLPGQEISGVFFTIPVTLTSDATARYEP